MASWPEVVSYMTTRYPVEKVTDGMVVINFDLDPGLGWGRGQRVFVMFMDLVDPTISFRSVVAAVGSVSPQRLLEVTATQPFGVLMSGDLYVLVHNQLLSTVDPPEIEAALNLLAIHADVVEQQLAIADNF